MGADGFIGAVDIVGVRDGLISRDITINAWTVEHGRIIATGRSDCPNQINNVLCFPGLFRGVLNVRYGLPRHDVRVTIVRATIFRCNLP